MSRTSQLLEINTWLDAFILAPNPLGLHLLLDSIRGLYFCFFTNLFLSKITIWL